MIRRLIIALLFICSFGIRLVHIDSPPLDFAPIRQYQSAHIARNIYLESADTVPEFRKQIARINTERMGFQFEPRLMENMSVIGYRISGGEHLWIPRVLSSIFWTIGGIVLYLTACTLASRSAAFFSAAFFLLLPYGISASRSFQPDPLMTMLIICGIYLILKHYERPSLLNLLSASIVASLAMFLKPYSVFMLLGPFISLSIYKHGFRKSLINRDLLIFSFLSIMPPASYYISDLLTDANLLRDHSQGSFVPHLLLEPYFWRDWLSILGRVFGYIPLICAAAGIFMFHERMPKIMLSGLWISYILFGMIFTFHIHTHDYYQMQFIPVVALSLGPPGARLMNSIPLLCKSKKTAAAIAAAILVSALFIGLSVHRNGIQKYKNHIKTIGSLIGINSQSYNFLIKNYEYEVKAAEEIGEIVGHSANTVFLTSDFGRSLAYHGELAGLPWPVSSSIQGRIERNIPIPDKKELFNPHYLLIRTYKSALFNAKEAPGGYIQYKPDYFIITALEEFEKQPDLKDFLYKNFPVFAQCKDYLIFDLRKMSE